MWDFEEFRKQFGFATSKDMESHFGATGEDLLNAMRLKAAKIIMNGKPLIHLFDEFYDKLSDNKIESYVPDGDYGCGLPGTIDWHITKVKQMSDKKSVQDYLKSVTQYNLKITASLSRTKKRAIKILKDWSNGNCK